MLVRKWANVYFQEPPSEKAPPPNRFVRFFSALLGTSQYCLLLVVSSEKSLPAVGNATASADRTLAAAAAQTASLVAYIQGFLGPTIIFVLSTMIIGMAMVVAGGATRAGPIRSFVLGAAVPALVHFVGSKVVT